MATTTTTTNQGQTQQNQGQTQQNDVLSNAGSLNDDRQMERYDQDAVSSRGDAPGDWFYEGAAVTEHDGKEGEKTVSARILKKTLKESKRLEPTIEHVENVEVVDGVAKVKISWKPPPRIRRENIKSYEIIIDPEGEEQSEESEEDSGRITQSFDTETTFEFDLKPSTVYVVRVIVIDTNDDEYQSEDTQFETDSLLSAPEIDEISELRSNDPNVKKVMITWIPPSGVEEKDIDEYQLNIDTMETGSRKVIVCPAGDKSRVCYLEPEVSYEVSLKVKTSIGEAESEKEEFQTGEPLGQPSITKIESVREDKENNRETMKVTWSPPDVDEDKILRFEATMEMLKPGKKSTGPQSETRTFPREADSGEFDLEIGAKYVCTVTIHAIHAEATSEPKVICADPAFGKPAIENIYELAPTAGGEKKKQVIVIWKAPAGVEKKDIHEYKCVYQVQGKDSKKSIKTKKTHAIFWLDPRTTFIFIVEVKTDVADGSSEEKSFSSTQDEQPVVKQNPSGGSGSGSSKSQGQGNKKGKDQNSGNKVMVYDNDRKMAGVVYVDKEVHDDIVKSQNQRRNGGGGSSGSGGRSGSAASGSGSGSGKSGSKSGSNSR